MYKALDTIGIPHSGRKQPTVATHVSTQVALGITEGNLLGKKPCRAEPVSISAVLTSLMQPESSHPELSILAPSLSLPFFLLSEARLQVLVVGQPWV